MTRLSITLLSQIVYFFDFDVLSMAYIELNLQFSFTFAFQKDLVNLLSEKEIYDLEMTFRELDKDGDGMITAEEAQLVYTRWLKNLLVVSEGILPR